MPELDARAMRRHAATAARLMRSLANPHRLLVLCVLSEGELSVSELNERIPLSQSALSQHLAVLRREKLVRTRRESQTIYYSVTAGPAMDIVRLLHEKFCCTPPRNVASPAASKATRRGN
ncbi:MAG: Transcriptional activator HlyU [Gammaproteobacteria bacterium]|nr:Transcriptional activator HlyU [Gammaproteobacteria bacterium]